MFAITCLAVNLGRFAYESAASFASVVGVTIDEPLMGAIEVLHAEKNGFQEKLPVVDRGCSVKTPIKTALFMALRITSSSQGDFYVF